jgi:hypothetical protein
LAHCVLQFLFAGGVLYIGKASFAANGPNPHINRLVNGHQRILEERPNPRYGFENFERSQKTRLYRCAKLVPGGFANGIYLELSTPCSHSPMFSWCV